MRGATAGPPGRRGTLVTDGSALVALLADGGPAGTWVAESIAGSSPAPPCLALLETANIPRRQARAGLLDQTEASLAQAGLAVSRAGLHGPDA